MALTQEQLEGDVDQDGTCPSYQDVQTDYARIEALGERVFDDGEGYLYFIGDYQDRFIEIRVPFSVLKENGWHRSDTA